MFEVRKISNEKNIRGIIIGAVMLLIGCIRKIIHIFKQKWIAQMFVFLLPIISIVGIMLIIICVINIIFNSCKNNELKKLAYRIDYQKELSTYKVIGYEKRKLKNGAQYFNKYCEWKNYIDKKYDNIKNNENAYHFMVRKYRAKESAKELLMSAILPLEVGVLSILYSGNYHFCEGANIFIILVPVVFLIVLITVNYFDYKEEVCFISDFMEIVFPEYYKATKR